MLVIIGVGLMAWPTPTHADTGLIYLSPGSSSVQSGSSVSFSLRINPGTTVDGAQATISYDTSKLQETSVDISSSAFPVPIQKTVGGGAINLTLTGISGGISSDSLLANLTFTALVGSGSTSLQISNANASNNGTYTNPSSSGATVNFTAPAASTPASGSASSSSGGTKKTATTSSTTPSTPAVTSDSPTVAAPKVVTTINLASVQYSLAKLVVNTNAPVQVALQYGTSPNKLDQSTAFTGLSTKNNISLDSTELTPGTTYYYQVITKDAAGNTTTSTTKSFKTKGYTFKVTILDSHYHPVIGKIITLHSTPTTAKTDSNGVATFTDVAPGAHDVIYDLSKTKTFSQAVYVENDISTTGSTQTAISQTAAVILNAPVAAGMSLLRIILTVLAVLIVLTSIYLLIITTPLRKIVTDKIALMRHVIPPMAKPPIIKPSS